MHASLEKSVPVTVRYLWPSSVSAELVMGVGLSWGSPWNERQERQQTGRRESIALWGFLAYIWGRARPRLIICLVLPCSLIHRLGIQRLDMQRGVSTNLWVCSTTHHRSMGFCCKKGALKNVKEKQARTKQIGSVPNLPSYHLSRDPPTAIPSSNVKTTNGLCVLWQYLRRD